MTKTGLLYEKLIVQPGPTLPVYYMVVQQVIEEMKAEFPHEDCYDWGSQRYEVWFKKWFGVDKNNE